MAGGGKTEKVLPRIHASMGHEMGIMWGFIAFMLLVTAAFAVFWIGKNKKQHRLERERQQVLRENGWGIKGWRNEKFGDKTLRTGEERVETVENGKDGRVVGDANANGNVGEKGSLGELR